MAAPKFVKRPTGTTPTASAELATKDYVDQHGLWQSYTPVWTAATTNPVLGNGTLVGRYCQIGKTVWVKFRLTIGSTTTLGSGDWSISLPVGPSVSHANLETFAACPSLCAGTYRVDAMTIPSGFSTFLVIATSVGSFYKSTTPGAWTTGNFINSEFFYELP